MKSTELKKKSSIPIKKYAALFGVLFIAAMFFLFQHFNEEPLSVEELDIQESSEQEKPEVGFLAPPFSLSNLKGNQVDLSSFRGQVVILNFWATWCVPCRVEMPAFENLYRRYRSQGLTVLAVSLDKNSDAKVKDFVEEYRLSFPVLMDHKGKAEKLYPTISIPFTFVIDQQGRVVARVDGAKNWESDETFEAIEYLLNNKKI